VVTLQEVKDQETYLQLLQLKEQTAVLHNITYALAVAELIKQEATADRVEMVEQEDHHLLTDRQLQEQGEAAEDLDNQREVQVEQAGAAQAVQTALLIQAEALEEETKALQEDQVDQVS